MAAIQDAKRVTTGEIRMSYVNVFEPRAMLGSEDKKYSLVALIPKRDTHTKANLDAAIAAAVDDGIKRLWGGKKPGVLADPIHDGDGLRPSGDPYGEECKGHWVINLSTKQKPGVVDASTQPIIDPSEVYSGMYGRVSIRFYPYAHSGKKGVGAGLGNVQKLRDGDRLGGSYSAEDDFGVMMGAAVGDSLL